MEAVRIPVSDPISPGSQSVFDLLLVDSPPDPAKVHSAVEAI